MRTIMTWLLGVAAYGTGCAHQQSTEAPERTQRAISPNEQKKEQAMNGSVSPTGDKHPGEIEYDDHVEHKKWTTPAADVPASIAWVKVADRWKAVVRIEINGAGDTREMISYGPDGEFLETTTGQLSGAPPGDPPSAPIPNK